MHEPIEIESANKQRLDIIIELTNILPKDKQNSIMMLVLDIAESAYSAGLKEGSKRDQYCGPSLPSINLYS